MLSPLPILLVEDDPDDVEFVRRAIETSHIRNAVRAVSSLEAAQRYLATNAPPLVIADIYLPAGQTGLDLIEWMRAQPEPTGSTPVIVLTISTQRTDEMSADALGVGFFIRKPVTPELLVDAIDALGLQMTRASSDSRDTIVHRR
jgi:CheY-like chemotaxis protein